MTAVQPRPEGGPSTTGTPLKVSSTDDPAVLAEQHSDDYSNHVVPLTARVGRWQLAMSFWSLLSAMVWLFYGALAAALYGTGNASWRWSCRPRSTPCGTCSSHAGAFARA